MECWDCTVPVLLCMYSIYAIPCTVLHCLLLVIIYALFFSVKCYRVQFPFCEYFVLLPIPSQHFVHVYFESLESLISVSIVSTNFSKYSATILCFMVNTCHMVWYYIAAKIFILIVLHFVNSQPPFRIPCSFLFISIPQYECKKKSQLCHT